MRDLDIRRRLRMDSRLHPKDPNTRIVQELGLCQGLARVDLAVVNGTIHGYEIKSEQDTLARLPAQAEVYDRVLDFVTVVIAPKHAYKVRKMIPRWWGIWTVISDAKGNIDLHELRAPRRNRNVSASHLVQLLWRDEALRVLAERKLETGMLSKSRKQIWNRLVLELSPEELGDIVRERIRNRAWNWRVVSKPV